MSVELEWCRSFTRDSQQICRFIDDYAWDMHEADPGAYTVNVVHVPPIRQPTIPDPDQDCHGDCGNDDAVIVRWSFQ